MSRRKIVAVALICCYDWSMSDPTRRTLVEIEADLDASDAEADAGEFVPAEVVHAKLKAALERLQHQPSTSQNRKTSPSR